MKQLTKKAFIVMLCLSMLALPLLGCAASTADAGTNVQTETSEQSEATAQKATKDQSASGEAAASSETETPSGEKKAPSKQAQGKAVEGGRASARKKKSADAGSAATKKAKPSDQSKPSGKSGDASGNTNNGSSSGNKRNDSSSKKKGSKNQSATAASAKALTNGETLNGGTYTATGDDESALTASGTIKASVTGANIVKSAGSASSVDGASFTGINAAVRVYDSAELTLTDCTVEASAPNATGVFAYDKGVIILDNCTVTVTGGGAGGIQVAGGGTLYGTNLTVTSASKAAIRSDRGGGLMVIDGGSYTSTGSNGCPAIYSTADITVSNAECVSTNSRAVIIEGKNSVALSNCTLTGNDQSSKEGSVRANVLLYQSASGDAKEGTSVFTMTGGSMTCLSGAMFYCTNTSSKIYLTDAELTLSDDGTLLIVSSGRWGKDGKNGGNCTLFAKQQSLNGDIIVDEISSLEIQLTESAYTGAIRNDGAVSVTIDSSSTWMLTGDSYVSEFNGDAANVISNGFTLYVNGVALTGTK